MDFTSKSGRTWDDLAENITSRGLDRNSYTLVTDCTTTGGQVKSVASRYLGCLCGDNHHGGVDRIMLGFVCGDVDCFREALNAVENVSDVRLKANFALGYKLDTYIHIRLGSFIGKDIFDAFGPEKVWIQSDFIREKGNLNQAARFAHGPDGIEEGLAAGEAYLLTT